MRSSNVVVGSGPVGVTIASFLLSRGEKVTLIDPVAETESEVDENLKRITLNLRKRFENSQKEFYAFTNYLLRESKDGRLSSHPGSKLHFGMSYPYVSAAQSRQLGIIKYNIAPRFSLTKGGLSNVWGSICMSYSNGDLADVPNAPSLEDFKFVDSLIQVAKGEDDFGSHFHSPSRTYPNIATSQLSNLIRERYNLHREWFQNNEILGGHPRVAVENSRSNPCRQCGICSVGCPWDLIWSSKRTIYDLVKNRNFRYISGVVIGIEEKKHKSKVEIELSTGESLDFEKLFLAAGPISTAILLSRSGLVPAKVFLDDSQLTLLPFYTGIYQQRKEIGFSLSKFLFFRLERNSNNVKDFVQITGKTFDVSTRVRGYVPIAKFIPKVLLDFTLGWIGVAMHFSSPDFSGKISIARDADRNITLSEAMKARIRKKKEALRPASDILKKIGFIPIMFFARQVGIGESYHLGRLHDEKNQNLFETNGKLKGSSNIYVCDSASLSKIVPGPLTYTAMANSARIARLVLTEPR